MRRHFKAVLVVVALVIASLLTITRHGARLGIGAVESLRAAPAGGEKKYDLASLHVFDATLKRISDSYVDPTRIEPKQMLLSALDNVQKQVAEVLVEPHPDQNKVVVRVDTATHEFSIGDVDSPWTLSQKMRDVFKFVAANVQQGTDLKELEYAATNGMLNTLDPHSVLLEPTVYAEMKLTTRGQFGGLGIVIGIRKGSLTVIKPMPNTPASNAGIKAGDHIVRIEKLSTVNMMLNDAVSRLRGEPGTKVDVYIERGGTPPKKFVLTRDIIQVKTIDAHQLANGIGYVKLSQFSGNSVEEMRRVLEEMKGKAPLKGIILDLRGDPGGLLDQAIKVADEFLDAGTIVTTVGYANKQREEKHASPGTQPKIPMAVLVNGGSASASEIVAGALKNLDRAVIIGSRTFGKGSVQVLYDNDDGSALKLTIAQYLTPGDVSIQSVGISPDIALEPTSIEKDKVYLFRQSHGLREQDLDAHLTSKNAKGGDKPLETVRYVAEKKKKDEKKAALLRDDEKQAEEEAADEEPEIDDTADEEKFVEDYDITFARDLLSQAKGYKRHEVIDSSKAFFQKKEGEEQAKIAAALSKIGVDWSEVSGDKPQGLQFAAQLETDKPQNQVAAGEVVTLKATVTNKTGQAVGQVRGITKCDDPWMADREFVFGKLGPGESRTWTVPMKVEKGALSRLDEVKLEITDTAGAKLETDAVKIKISGLKRPRFAYAYQIIDDLPSTKDNGDGLVQRGEEVRLHVTVKNVGEGKAYKTSATLSDKSGEGIDVNKGRFDVDNLQPGESKSVDFTFQVAADYKEDKFSLQMDVYDSVLHEYVTDKLTFPVSSDSVAVQQSSGEVAVVKDSDLRAGASATASVVGKAARGAALKVTGKSEGFYRVEAEQGRPAFVAVGDVKPGSGGTFGQGKFQPILQVSPPRLVIDNAPLAVNAPTFKLKVQATDEKQVADGYVFVSNRSAKIDHRKVFYRSNRKGQTPNTLDFEADIPVWPGANMVTVVTRQSNQVQSQQTLIVDREGPPISQDQRASVR